MAGQILMFPSARELPTEFDVWWSGFPNKVAKGAARRAWVKARMIATFAELVNGVEAYKKNKPDYAEWCHPASWLHAERWLDEPAPATSCRTQDDPDVAVRQRAKMILRGLPCPGVTFRQLARMVELGLVSRDQIARY